MQKLNRLYKGVLMTISALILCAQTIASDVDTIASIKNLKTPTPHYFVGGQPTVEQFDALAEAGVVHVINLRPVSETPKLNEASLVEGRGMIYHSLPVDGAAGLTLSNIKTFDQLLKLTEDEKVFLHCASGNRVGALMALRSVLIYGEDKDVAILEGKAWGLTHLEPEVLRLIGGI